MTERAFVKARNSLSSLLDNLSDRDRFKDDDDKGVADSIKAGIDASGDVVAKCTMPQANALAKIAVHRGVSDDLNLYPVSAERKLGRDLVRKTITDYEIEELTLKDMLYFVGKHVEGREMSRYTMPKIYQHLQAEYGFDVYMSKVVAQVYFIPKNPLKIVGWGVNDAGKKLLERGVVKMDDAGTVSMKISI